MVEITKKDNYTYMDCCPNLYEIKTNNGLINFYQLGNRDLYFTCMLKEYKKEVELKVNIYNDYLLYKEVDNLYKDLTDLTRWEYVSEYTKFIQTKFFNGKYINWESDDYISSIEPDNNKNNYLNIYQKENEYIIKFINNSDKNIFSIAFNTDRSKYDKFVFAFYSFLNNLSKVIEDNHQIDFDEYMIIKKLIRKRD